MSRKKAIELKCKDCTYEPLDKGTWRQQVAKCTQKSCPLYDYRHMPSVTSVHLVIDGKQHHQQHCEAI